MAEPSETANPEVSIIVPARNEEVSLGDCLQSLVRQTGATFEVIVVDDGSTDRTREIAESFAGVHIISAPPLPPGWTGKNNAVVAGAAVARGEWLLFTDADTFHVLGSLAGAVAEAKEHGVDMLSYSPEQTAVTFWEMAELPVVFAELAREYPPRLVSDPASPIAAANGQYILIRREAYDSVGGHRAVAESLLEDVALARAVKAAGRKIRFRYAADAVRTRMYRNFGQLREGWTKNLALLFSNPGLLAVKSLAFWGLAWGIFLCPMVAAIGVRLTGRVESVAWMQLLFRALAGVSSQWWWRALGIGTVLFIGQRLRRANFTWDMEVLGALAGYPMFSYLLWRSKLAHSRKHVSWKGRHYDGRSGGGGLPSAAEAVSEGNPVIAAVNRCATQSQVQPRNL